ncbi:phage holin family protein [Xinfangfangia pollutisoli]|uniref:phage holin family protein n=1 Tax=Xinfangfangia pollutisoli TaxID=2865960 RepID=UPI001CD5B6BD|nr:phage holin family protein [Xinfangfangia pollutisoli]
MPADQAPGLIETLQSLIGGAATALIAGFTGRLMYHAGEVRARRRPILSWDLAWEAPLAIGMALIGDGLGSYLDLSREMTVGLIALLSYLGPRGAGALLERWLALRRP